MTITKEKYESALARVEELLPLVDEYAPADNPLAIELVKVSEIVIQYEEENDQQIEL